MRSLGMGVLWVVFGCASGAATHAGVPFTPEDAQAFDNGVDFMDKPVIVESEWRGVFERRVTHADVIAVVEVESISADEDRRGSGYRLTTRLTEPLRGQAPAELVLRVHDDESGFRSVQTHEERLLGGSFVVFVKWHADSASDLPVPRWHLSPDSGAVRDKVAFFSGPPPIDERTEVEVLAP